MIKKTLLYTLIIALGLILSIMATLAFNYYIYPHKMAIMQSYTDNTSSGFVIVSKWDSIDCQANIIDTINPVKIKSENTKSYSFKESKSFVHHCNFNNLIDDSKYQLQVINSKNEVLDTRIFKTLSSKQDHFSIAIESCTSDLFHIPILWDNLKSHQPDYLFMIGDNVYADLFHFITPINEPHIWQRYIHSWLVFKLFQQKELTPILAIWDDHDYGENNGDTKYKSKEFSKKLFRTFFNQNKETTYLNQGPGVSFSFTWKQNHFIFLDNRYFRDTNDDKTGTYFSKEQVIWLKEKLQAHPKEYFWLISGNQWYSSPEQDESFENNHPQSLKDFFKEIAITKYNTILVSGDAHMSEIKKIGIENKYIYELTSSGMHVYPMSNLGSDDRRISGSNNPNFMIIKLNFQNNTNIEVSDYTLFNIKNFSNFVNF